MYGGIIHILENIKVKNIIISKQKQSNEYLEKLLAIAENKDINLIIAEAGSRINLDKNTYFDI